MAERESNGKSLILKAIGVLAPPLVGCLGAAVAFYYGVQFRLQTLDERLLLLRQSIERADHDDALFRAVGPDGFTHGLYRAGLNSTIRVETRHLVPRDELERKFTELYRNNPTLREP